MNKSIIIRREAIEQSGLMEKILPLSKIASAEQQSWILVPEDNLTEIIHLLQEYGIQYRLTSMGETPAEGY